MASIGVGKWRDKIDAALAQDAVCVAVIGPRWANADNLRRLEDERHDLVRHELVTALASDALTLVLPLPHREETMPYKMAGIDVHKKVLMVVVMDAQAPDCDPERRRFATMPSDLRRLSS